MVHLLSKAYGFDLSRSPLTLSLDSASRLFGVVSTMDYFILLCDTIASIKRPRYTSLNEDETGATSHFPLIQLRACRGNSFPSELIFEYKFSYF
jgi:hypothetical protein